VHTSVRPCAYEKIPGEASAPLPPTYRPRQPQKSVLHRVVREHLLSFLAEGVEKSMSGEGTPYYVEKEFRDYLSCADLSRGFSRVRCGACGHEFLLPFSCKNRGLCPSCTARRMSDEAAFLVDSLLPQAPYRQWTLTFPWAVRYQLAKDYTLITKVLRLAMRSLFSWQKHRAKRAGHLGTKSGAVTFVQRFGGALNLNVHLHVLLPARFQGQLDLFEDPLGSAETLTRRRGPQSRPSSRAPPEEPWGEWTVELDEPTRTEDWGS
jgi:hypothetical protein